MACHKTLPPPCGEHDHHHHHHHHDDGCAHIACECADAAAHSAKAASDAAMLAQKILQNCLTDKTIKPGGGLVYEEGTPPGEGGIIVKVADIINQMMGLGVDANGDAIVKLMANGGLAFNGNGEIYTRPQDFIRVGGGLAIGVDDGKVYVDFSQMPTANRLTLVNQIIQDGGGLAVDSNGQIYVDFTKMPTDKFEALLKSLRLPLYIDSSLNLYVNGSSAAATDNLAAKPGLTRELPFKTIQAAANYASENYNLGPHNIFINIAPSTYTESLALGGYTATTGRIYLRPDYQAASGRVNLVVGQQYYTGVRVSGNVWQLTDLDIEYRPVFTNSIVYPMHGLIAQGGDLILKGCKISFTDASGISVDGGNNMPVTLLCASNNSMISLAPSDAGMQQMQFIFDPSGALAAKNFIGSVIYCNLNSNVDTLGGEVSEAASKVLVSGKYDHFIFLNNASKFALGGLTPYPLTFAASGSVTGRRYRLLNGSYCSVLGRGAEYFPGSEDGYLDASTYCWYK